MPQDNNKTEKYFLLPGEYITADKTGCIVTLLGSCVAVCLWDKVRHIGGMNHFLLPDSPAGVTSNTKYGDAANKILVESMENLGAEISNMQAQIFGGGDVVENIKSGGTGIGQKNIKSAILNLGRYGIKITNQDIGGKDAKKIYFEVATGQVTVKRILMSQNRQRSAAKAREFESRPIRVLTVDDSPTVSAILKKLIVSEPRFELIGQAYDAYEAREMIVQQDPDVITLDIIMPRINGLEFLRRIMKYYPKPVIIISTIAKEGSKIAGMARFAGACNVIDKESLCLYGGLEKAKRILLSSLEAAVFDLKV